jgi:hypothetical protein
VALLGCGTAFTEAQAQPRLYGCSRPTIEAYPEAEKRPVLQFLDEARALADKSAQLFAAGRLRELYALRPVSFRKEHTEEVFRQMLAALEQREGKILEYEYRVQSLIYTDPSEIDLQRDFSEILYAVKTTKREDGAFLRVLTRREVVVQIDMGHFDPDYPAGLRYSQASGDTGCPFIKGPLKLKAPK